jgi:NADH-quinone oxidoreductase subunit C
MSILLQERLKTTFQGLEVTMLENTRMAASAKPDSIQVILSYLKQNGFNHLALISCVDWINEGNLELVYILTFYSVTENTFTDDPRFHIYLKTFLERANPKIQSVFTIFESAEPYEREIHELFGVVFEGHPRLKPLLLERAYKIPPSRKDFNTREYVKNTFEPIPPVED